VTPQRVVSLVPSATETVCRLGAGARLVGCTRYCVEPAEVLAALPRVGGTKNPARERILALQPDLVLANAEENRPEDLDWLGARVPLCVQTPRTVPQARDGVLALGDRLGAEPSARDLAAAIDEAMAAVAAHDRTHGRVRSFYAIWRRPWMSVAQDTYIADVLARAGAENVCGDAAARYPVVEPEQLAAAGAGLVLLASEPWAFTSRDRDELAAQRSFGAAAIAVCDGRDFCWHGAHTAVGLRRAAALLLPYRPAIAGS
jgi:ABC-type Fe3+-hydroxamate transport system substrate-binding protein